MKTKRKGFTLIELIVVMAIIAILVLIAAPKFMGYTQKANYVKTLNNIKSTEKAAELYYMEHDLWPRDQTKTHYTSEQLNTWVNEFRNLAGKTIVLNPEAKYYDVDWNLMKGFIDKPDNEFKYIIQNPIGDVYYAYELTQAGEESKFNGLKETTSISVNISKNTINIGETISISATVSPENAIHKTVDWISSNPSIATVNENGVISGISAGVVTITAKSKNNNITSSTTLTVLTNMTSLETGVVNNFTTVLNTKILGLHLTERTYSQGRSSTSDPLDRYITSYTRIGDSYNGTILYITPTPSKSITMYFSKLTGYSYVSLSSFKVKNGWSSTDTDGVFAIEKTLDVAPKMFSLKVNETIPVGSTLNYYYTFTNAAAKIKFNPNQTIEIPTNSSKYIAIIIEGTKGTSLTMPTINSYDFLVK